MAGSAHRAGFPWSAKAQPHFNRNSTKEFLENKTFYSLGERVFQKRGGAREWQDETSDPARGPCLEECDREGSGLGWGSRPGLSL